MAFEESNRHRPQEEQLLLLSATTDGFILGVPNRGRVLLPGHACYGSDTEGNERDDLERISVGGNLIQKID
jgi:hypothetical protein